MHVGAPMPGMVSTLAVAAGQAVKAGDVLLSIEAMKMETALHAERDGTSPKCWSAPATRSTPRICWWSSGGVSNSDKGEEEASWTRTFSIPLAVDCLHNEVLPLVQCLPLIAV